MKPELKMKHDGSVKVFDFFSGCGGASCGFRNAGMEIVFALDCDDDAKRTFETNFPDARFEHVDIRNVSVRAIRELMACHRPAPILFCGCAPCQPFTSKIPFSRRRPPMIAYHFFPTLLSLSRIVSRMSCSLRNVPGIQRIQHGSQPFARFVSSLERSGYTISRAEAVPLMQYGCTPESPSTRVAYQPSWADRSSSTDARAWERVTICHCPRYDCGSAPYSCGGGSSRDPQSSCRRALGAESSENTRDWRRGRSPRVAGVAEAYMPHRHGRS